MGVDLRLFIPSDPDNDWWLVGSDIQIERRRELWDPISEIESRPIRRLRGFDGSEWGDLEKDNYGEELRYVQAGALAALAGHEAACDHPKNVAAFAYIRALPPDWPVVLWWC